MVLCKFYKGICILEIRDVTEGKCRHYYFGCSSIQFLTGGGRHYLFWLSLFVLAFTTCEQKLNGESAKIIMTTFAFHYVSYFLNGICNVFCPYMRGGEKCVIRTVLIYTDISIKKNMLKKHGQRLCY